MLLLMDLDLLMMLVIPFEGSDTYELSEDLTEVIDTWLTEIRFTNVFKTYQRKEND